MLLLRVEFSGVVPPLSASGGAAVGVVRRTRASDRIQPISFGLVVTGGADMDDTRDDDERDG